MEFASFLTKTKVFLTKRIAEFFGFIIIIFSALLLISILSYSPNDPNFIVNDTDKIANWLGFRGSVISDFIFQSIGLVAYLVPITLFFSGLNILVHKKNIILVDNLFFCIFYVLFGSLFFFLLYRSILFFNYKWKWWVRWNISQRKFLKICFKNQ